jgi:hypothetical protein
MVDFKKAKFGDKFVFLPTGEICEYISCSDNAVNLRPIDYTGLMVYVVQFGCLNEDLDWEAYEDNWNLFEDGWEYEKRISRDVLKKNTLETLKEKILKDIYEATGKDMINISYGHVKDILNKRWGC